jgi:hypothetical protein
VQPSRAEKARLRQEAKQRKAQANKEFRFQTNPLQMHMYNQQAYGPGHPLAPKPLPPFPGAQSIGAAGMQLTQTMPGYAAYARNLPAQPAPAYAPLNDRTASHFVRASPDQRYHQHNLQQQHHHQQQMSPARLDNSPRYQNYYTEAESRYTTQQAQEYHRRYQALAAATQLGHQRGSTPPTPPGGPRPQLAPAALAPPPAAVTRPARAAFEPEGRQPQPETQHLAQAWADRDHAAAGAEAGGAHFTPPSLRPEMRAAAAADAASGAGSLQQPFRFNAPEAGGRFQTSEQFSASVGDAAARLGRGRFDAMMRRLGEVGAAEGGGYGEEGGARTPPGRPISPLGPEFSPLSDG